MSQINIVNISDSYIIQRLTKNRVVNNYQDFNLRSSTSTVPLVAVSGGLYDSITFGSFNPKSCNCGRVKMVGARCNFCGSSVLSELERSLRYAAYYAPVRYTTNIRSERIREIINSTFETIIYQVEPDLAKGYKGVDKIYLYQYNYDPLADELIITDDLTDESKIGLDGILKLFREHASHRYEDILSLSNTIVPVTPIAMRPFNISYDEEGKRRVTFTKHNVYYRMIIAACEEYRNEIQETPNLYVSTILKAILGTFIGRMLTEGLSDLSKPSKSNFTRIAYSDRVKGSGRAVIIPDMDLKVDEVGIPITLAYELYKREFINSLSVEYSYSMSESISIYNQADDETLELFVNFIEKDDNVVILNRNPTLHKYNTLAMKVRIVNDNCIHLPPIVCSLFGADFDGDEMNFFKVDQDLSEYVSRNASPKNMNFYEKDHKFLLKFNHETLNGLIIASKVKPSDIRGDKPKEYVSIDDMEKDYLGPDNTIEVYSEVIYGGKYTSYGRLKISEILGVDLDNLVGEGVVLNAKNINEIYTNLASRDADERSDIMQQLQEFSQQVVYFEGETTLRLSEIYQGVDEGRMAKIHAINDSDKFTKDEKLAYIDEIYSDYVDDFTKNLDNSIKTRISESSRMKMNSFVDMSVPQMILSGDNSVKVLENSLVSGMTEDDLVHAALNNRKQTEMKFNTTSTSGWLSRQASTIAHRTIMRRGEDVENGGIRLPRDRAEGRTDINGKILGRSNDSSSWVMVRSIVTSDLPYMTPDMVSTFMDITFDSDGTSNVGLQSMGSLFESSTQRGLSLKHGGSLFSILPEDRLLAPADGVLEIYDNYFVVVSGTRRYEYPRGSKLVMMRENNTKVYKDEVIAKMPKLYTFSYGLDSIIKLSGAMGSVSVPGVRNQLRYARCLVYSEESIVDYDFDANVMIVDGERIYMDPDRLYYRYKGEKLIFTNKFCSGIENISTVSKKLGYLDTFYVFRSLMLSLLPGTSDEIVEIFYAIVTDKNTGEYKGVHRTNLENKSFMERLSYGYASSGLVEAVKGGLEVTDSTYTTSAVNPIMIGNLLDGMFD